MRWHMGMALLMMAVVSWSALAQKGASPKTAKSGAKTIYCWEEQGKRVCADALPAQASGQARAEINARTGTTQRTIERALTPEERAAAEQQAVAHKEMLVQQALAQRSDDMLLNKYPTAQDLTNAFSERRQVLDTNIQLGEKTVRDMRQSVLQRLTVAAQLELAGKKVSPIQHRALMEAHQRWVLQQKSLQQQKSARAAWDEEQQKALAAYHGAQQRRSRSAPPPAATPN